jgi:hypothetical protein
MATRRLKVLKVQEIPSGYDPADYVSVVGNAELVGDCEEQRVCFRDGFIFPELLNDDLRFSGVAAAEDGLRLIIDEADLIFFLAGAAEIGAVVVIHQGKNAAAD